MPKESTDQLPRDHRTLFLGREEDLKWLQEAWELAKKGKPQMRILIAESGYGKTRIAQAFYNWLSTEKDPENYWPDTLSAQDKSLQVMPNMIDLQMGNSLPWFWWGLHWVDPRERNNNWKGCEFFKMYNEDPVFTAFRKRLFHDEHTRKTQNKLLLKAGSILASMFLPFIGGFFELKDVIGIHGEHKKHLRAETVEGSEEDQINDILEMFYWVLDPSKRGGISCPLVLLLDEAQWVDPLSLKVIDRVWTRSVQRNLPLLIVATHWEAEWNLHYKPGSPEGALPVGLFASWVWKLHKASSESGAPLARVEERKLGKLQLEDVRQILDAAFPGLDSVQADFMCQTASGNPLHIHEMIDLLKRKPNWFVNNDFTRALVPKWQTYLTTEQLRLETIQSERFDSIEKHLKDMLGTASIQGSQFFHDFIWEVAQKLGYCQRAAHDAPSANPLHAAEKPYALAEAARDKLSMEFRSATIRHCAARHLEQSPNEDAVKQKFVDTAREWINSWKMSHLPLEFQLRLLGSARQLAEDTGSPSDQALFIAHALVQIRNSQLFFYAKDWIAAWKKLAPQAEDLRSCDFWLLFGTAELLREVGEAAQAESLANKLEDNTFLLNEVEGETADMARFGLNALKGDLARQSGNLEVALKHYVANLTDLERWGESPERITIHVGMLQRVGHVEIELGQEQSALARLRDCVKLCEQHSEQFSDSQESLNSLASLRFTLASLEKRLGYTQNALLLYHASLGDFKQLHEYFRESPELLLNIALALGGVADTEHQLGQEQSRSACGRYKISLQLLEQIREKFDDPELVRFSALLCLGSANAEWAIGNMQRAWQGYVASLETLKSMRQHIGEPHQVQVYSDIAEAHLKLGDMLQAFGQTQRSLGHYQNSLIISTQLCKDYGPTSELLSDTALTLLKVADVEVVLGQTESSLNHYQASLQIRKQLREQFGESPQLLCNLAAALGGSDLEHALEPTRSALERYLHRSEISKQLHDQFAQSPEFLSDLDGALAMHAAGEHELQSMQAALQPIHERLKQLCDQPSESPEILRETALCLRAVADKERSLGRMRNLSALKNHQASLAIHKQVLDDFGETPQRLRGMVKSLTQLAGVELALGHTQNALGRYKASLALIRPICEKLETPDLLRDFADALYKVASVELELGETESALEHYHESLAVLEKIPHDSKQSPQACIFHAIQLLTVADVEFDLGQTRSALEHYRNSLALAEQNHERVHNSQRGRVLAMIETLQSQIADAERVLGSRSGTDS